MGEEQIETKIYCLRTTANREDQVMDFVVIMLNVEGHSYFAVIKTS